MKRRAQRGSNVLRSRRGAATRWFADYARYQRNERGLLATRFGKHFVSAGQKAHMLLVSSMASLAPMPYQALYGGTKAFLTNYGQALRHELSRHGIKVGVFLPGGIVTEMTELSGISRIHGSGDVGMMQADVCARYAVDALRRGSAASIPGASNHLMAVAMRSLPKSLVVPFVERLYRNGVDGGSKR